MFLLTINSIINRKIFKNKIKTEKQYLIVKVAPSEVPC